MNIYDTLKQTKYPVRIHGIDRWIEWDSRGNNWQVIEKRPDMQVSRTIYYGDSEQEAVIAFMAEFEGLAGNAP